MTIGEFLKLLRDQFFVLLYLITWIVSVLRYKRFFDTPLKYFPMLIMYTFFTEVLGYFIKNYEEFQFFSDERYAIDNLIIYNIYQLIFFLFFFDVYRKIFKEDKDKKLFSYASIVCVILYVANAIYSNPLHSQMTYAHILGSLLMVSILVFYLIKTCSTAYIYPLRQNLLFWVSIGLLTFYIPFPIILTLYKLKVGIGTLVYLRPILVSSIALMYGLIIIGLLIGKRKAFR